MTVESNISRNNYLGNGASSEYSFTFKAIKITDIKVLVNNGSDSQEELTLGIDYNVTEYGTSSGGTIELIDDSQDWINESGFLKEDYEIAITRDLSLVQETDIRNQGDFYPEVHEDAFDRGVMISQQISSKVDRSLKLPESFDSSSFDSELPLSALTSPGKSIIVKEDGSGFGVGPSATEIASAQGYATIAQEAASSIEAGYGTLNDVTIQGISNNSEDDQSAEISLLLESKSTLYFPPGVYYLGDVELTNKMIHGPGEIKKASTAERTFILNSNVVIDGLKFSSDTTGTQRSELKLNDSADNITIRNCSFNGELYAAISADSNGNDDSELAYSSPATNIVITQNYFKGYSRQLYLHSVKDVVISNNKFTESTRDAIRLRQNTGMCSIVNNVFKDVGFIDDSIVERPANWLSTGESYAVDDLASVPPYGIYKCTEAHTSSALLNPATGGAAKWTLVDGSYFETKDAIDSYWSGRELIISNNLVDGTASVGFDIKGSEPDGLYSTDSILITNNIVKNTFGIGINFHSSNLLNDSSFRYVGNTIISNNIISSCNAERYDVSQAAINLRQGCSNVTVSDNHIKNHFGRGINILNLDEDSSINRSLKISGNQVIDCGLPGHPGNIGINVSPVNGAIIKDNIVENTNFIPEYEISFSGTKDDSTFTIGNKVSRASISIDTSLVSDLDDFIDTFVTELEGTDFPDDPNPLLDITYYENVVKGGTTISFSSRVPGAFDSYEGTHTSAGITLAITKNDFFTNSVNKAGLIIRDGELVGSTTFYSGLGKMIIKDNIFRNNASAGRYEILYNGREIAAPIAYVTTDNSAVTTEITGTFAATNFTGGDDSDASNHLNSFAEHTFNGIGLRARQAGSQGNDILISLEDSISGPGNEDLDLRCIVSLSTTVSGYSLGGSVIRILKGTDETGTIINPTVAEVEAVLKTHLNQAIFTCKDNILE